MANSSKTSYLEQHNGRWRVTIAVPKSLRDRLGTRLKESLGTDSLVVANQLKWAVIDKLKGRIAKERLGDLASAESLLEEAAGLRGSASAAQDDGGALLREAVARAYEVLGRPVRVEVDEPSGGLFGVYEAGRERLARTYLSVVAGGALPLRLHYGMYRQGLGVKARTAADDERAMKFLEGWCAANDLPDDVRAITTKVAKAFAAELPRLAGGIAPRTVKKYVSRLSCYWQWMIYPEIVIDNPWRSVVVEVPRERKKDLERPFTNDEVRRLLMGGARPALLDLMRIGALSGARLDAIVDLKVKDTLDGAFTFKAQKKEESDRDVPIHPDLADVIARRVAGKKAEDDLFPEWPGPKKQGSMRERSFKASNEFTAYRRACGVDEVVPGKRRSLVNFHSFRRWFISRSEQAGYDGDLIGAISGHKRENSDIVLGRYSEGPEMRRARRCVASVKLPVLDDGPSPEPKTVIRRR